MAIAHGRHERRGAEGADGVGSREGYPEYPQPLWGGVWGGGSAPPQKTFVILHFKWCIFMQFGVGIFTLKGV